ncbi:MAG: putative metal-binding motif-containing protein [Myxococcota bacterium]|nr:putative metal-binding motif-containing protein [Myxococcota bacterium]
MKGTLARWLPALASMVLGFSCSDPAPPGVAGGMSDVNQADGSSRNIGDDAFEKPEITAPDLGPDTSGPTEGGPGWPCAENDDCDSGWCVPTPNGTQSSELCIENCTLTGWSCKSVENLAGGDNVSICLPDFPHLCDPCISDSECNSGLGDTGDRCIERDDGLGSFCGGACSDNVPCPGGYSCQTFDLGAAGTVRQCSPLSGQCECSQAAVIAGDTTICELSNEYGSCTGIRSCTVDGLTECDAASPTQEICNGVDDNCDGATDEQDAADCVVYYKDVDNDQYGVDGDTRCLCAPNDVYRAPQGGDCNDTNNDVNPGEDETCNNKDDNCNDLVDEEGAVGCTKYWLDEDEDSWGAGEAADNRCLCEAEGKWTALKPDDCLDNNNEAFPGAPETCNGIDSNCDKQVGPENTPGCVQYYLDLDNDGFGINTDSKCLCGAEGNYSTTESGDCNDALDSIKPGAIDICDTIDNDCDSVTDPPGSDGCQVYFQDLDSDTFGNDAQTACLCEPADPFDALLGNDCNDQVSAINPNAIESCNGLDDDCDTVTDEPNSTGCQTYYEDADFDGYGDANSSECLCSADAPFIEIQAGDCNDNLEYINPEAEETCNEIDDNCDGDTDEEDAAGCTTFYLDGDGDDFGIQDQQKCLCESSGSFTATLSGDCKDNNENVNPDGIETCGNALDDNCNGETDENNAVGCQTYYEDFDKDTFGVSGNSVCACTPEFPFTAEVGGDCKDTNDEIKPGQIEVCNLADDDCNGTTDDEGAEGCSNLFIDSDGDTFGVPGSAKCLCAASGNYKADKGGDCNDEDLLVYPGEECAPATCDNYLITAPTLCAGDGQCSTGGATAPCPGGFVCANENACLTACITNNDCQPGTFCVAGACSGKKLDGAPCISGVECQSDHCQNGFCCASGDCCGGSPSHCNDDSVCTNDICSNTFQCEYTGNNNVCAAPTCDGNVFTGPKICNDGTCSAGGVTTKCTTDDACLVSTCTLSGCVLSNAIAGTTCAEPTCTGATFTKALKCDGSGGCAIGGSTALCPGGFVCNDSGTACLVTCEINDHCQESYYCDTSGAACLPQKADGEACTADIECINSCDNGFCCGGTGCCAKHTDCNDNNVCTTDVCSPAFECQNTPNTDQCASGYCNAGNYIEAAFCAGGTCDTGGATVDCASDDPCLIGTCTTSGCGATPSPIGTICATAFCNGYMVTTSQKCDGTGDCSLGGSMQPCAGGYTCASDGIQCLTTCQSNAQCQSNLYCDSGVCLPQKDNGDPCDDSTECLTGYCNNGFCCTNGTCCAENTNCDDENVCTTDKCNSLNKCSYTFNTATCDDSSCNGTTYTAPKTCFAGACTAGGAVSECAGNNPCFNYGCGTDGCELSFALEGTVCSPASCVGSNITNASTCTATGQCNNPGTVPCPGGYICANPTMCRTFCTDDSQCQTTHYCDSNATCQPKRDDGEPCGQAKQCNSDYCANGFCCGGGTCCANTSDCDDDDVCTTDTCSPSTNICSYTDNSNICQPGSCQGLTYTDKLSCNGGACISGGAQQDCSGTNTCKVYGCSTDGCTVENASAGLICQPQSCSGFSITAATTCNGNGSCSEGGATTPCAGGYTCLNSTQCRSGCTTDTHCQSGYFCGSGICQFKRQDGDACVGSYQCNSNYCANGYCCSGPTGL